MMAISRHWQIPILVSRVPPILFMLDISLDEQWIFLHLIVVVLIFLNCQLSDDLVDARANFGITYHALFFLSLNWYFYNTDTAFDRIWSILSLQLLLDQQPLFFMSMSPLQTKTWLLQVVLTFQQATFSPLAADYLWYILVCFLQVPFFLSSSGCSACHSSLPRSGADGVLWISQATNPSNSFLILF